MRKNKKIKILLFFLLLFLLSGASFVLAQKPLEITYPEIPGAITPTTTKEPLPDYIRYIFQLSLFVGGIIAFGSFVYGGFRYLTSFGSPSVQNDARSRITGAMLGLVILVSSYIILNTLNPQLVAMKVSLVPGGQRLKPAAGLTYSTATHVEIPLGALIENLWGSSPKEVDCYNFDSNGEKTALLTDHDRLDCIKKLSEAIKRKAEILKTPLAELSTFYDCNNCCEDCCYNACSSWAVCESVCEKGGVAPWWHWENCGIHTCCENTQKEGCWEGCGGYTSCEGQGMDGWKPYCRSTSCDYFQSCACQDSIGSICRDPETKTPCSYSDPIIQEKVDLIQGALPNLQIKMGFFPLTEKMREPTNLDQLLSDEDTKTLIKNLLIYQGPGYSQISKDKLKELLKTKEVMTYLISDWQYRDLLLANSNISKTILKAAGLLGNEAAINEIAWMGTKADSSQEWIELYNNTREDIDLSGWKLVIKNKSEINLSGQIPSQGFYLLENAEAATDVPANLVYSGNLSDSGEILELQDSAGNLVDRIDCHTKWFAGDATSKSSMEKADPKEEGDSKNWFSNLSNQAAEEQKQQFINGKDSAGNPVYGTPKSANSVGFSIVSYPSIGDLVWDLKIKLDAEIAAENEEGLKDKLILLLRKPENLEKLVKSDETLKEVLVGSNERLKRLLQERIVLRMLFETEGNLDQLLNDTHAAESFKTLLEMEDETWDDFKTQLFQAKDETTVNSNLINDFQRDLSWVLEARDLMRGCDEDPVSIDQMRVPGLFPNVQIEKVPEWQNIETNITLPGDIAPGHDPATFYCHKPLW